MKKRIYRAGVLLAGLTLGSGWLYAESTKEIFTETGFYSPNQNLFDYGLGNWGPSGSTITINSPDGSAPEGQKSWVVHQQAGQWSGGGIYNVAAPNSSVKVPQDYSDYANGWLRFWLKSNITTILRLEYGTAGAQTFPISFPSTNGVWVEKEFPISGFGLTLANLQQLESPFILVADAVGVGSFYYVDHIRWTKPLGSLVAFPTQLTTASGAHREIVVEGRSGAGGSGELVDVYPVWTVTGTGASVSPGLTPSRYTILSMGTQTATVTAHSGASIADVVSTLGSNTTSSFGILSETISGLTLDTDSSMLASTSGTGSIVLSDDVLDFMEGPKSTKAQVSLPGTGSGGLYIQEGVGASPDTVTRNMSTFYDGSLKFWFKGQPGLQNFMQVGMRSGNVPSSTELSKIALAPYTACDNTWHAVAIPLSVFARAAPYADLSRTKIYFEIFAVSNGVGPGNQSFWVDNVRWDSAAPGALASISITPPGPITLPTGSKRNFSAIGLDASGNPIDIFPTWSMLPSLGTLTSQGAVATLTAQSTPVAGSLTAQVGGLSGSVNVNVASVTYTQAYNVYSDAGTGGTVGVSFGVAGGNNMLLLSTSAVTNGAPAGMTSYMRANWTLVDSTPGAADAFSVWYVGEPIGSRYMQAYKDVGYLQFWVRTPKDLQVSFRSANLLPPGTERCKFRLSELAVPLDGNWQLVSISMADALSKEPNLDFSQIANYFTIGVISNQIGTGSGVFDVAGAQWVTTNTSFPSAALIYGGLTAKQNAVSGLVLSFDSDVSSQAFTYDQALAAMAYTYKGDTALAKKIFDGYQSINPNGNGYSDCYNWANKTVQISNTTAGPNAWMLLSLMHYRNITGDVSYDTMINGLANWLKNLQQADGGVSFDPGHLLQKSTEHNFDCYAAFMAYYKMTGTVSYQTAANNVLNWLATKAWDTTPPGGGSPRFDVGYDVAGVRNTDKALDAYSWAPLATSSFTSVLNVARTDLENTQNSGITGFSVDGFDMGGIVGQAATYKDAVWLEGTAQMAEAYQVARDSASANYFINQIEKAISPISTTAQGLTYATNGGTGYGGFPMDSLHAAVSSMAWYLFAKNHFNPFRPLLNVTTQIKNVSDNSNAAQISWDPSTINLPTTWVVAKQYVALSIESNRTVWGMQIYTDNTASDNAPQVFTGTATITDPSGLIDTLNHQLHLPMAWTIKDSTGTPPVSAEPNNFANDPNASQWLYFKDQATVDIPSQGTVHFTPGEQFVEVFDSSLGMHTTQTGFTPAPYPVAYVYFEANFNGAVTPNTYKTSTLRLEFFQP